MTWFNGEASRKILGPWPVTYITPKAGNPAMHDPVIVAAYREYREKESRQLELDVRQLRDAALHARRFNDAFTLAHVAAWIPGAIALVWNQTDAAKMDEAKQVTADSRADNLKPVKAGSEHDTLTVQDQCRVGGLIMLLLHLSTQLTLKPWRKELLSRLREKDRREAVDILGQLLGPKADNDPDDSKAVFRPAPNAPISAAAAAIVRKFEFSSSALPRAEAWRFYYQIADGIEKMLLDRFGRGSKGREKVDAPEASADDLISPRSLANLLQSLILGSHNAFYLSGLCGEIVKHIPQDKCSEMYQRLVEPLGVALLKRAYEQS